MLKPKNAFAEQYQLKKLVDAKGLAEVWEAIALKTHPKNDVALKIFPKVALAGIQDIEKGYLDQPKLSHSHLLPAKHFGIYKSQPYLEMHFCNGGNVGNKIRQLNENEITRCLHQIASAVAYLHDNLRLHQCIKPSNILIDGDNYYCYFADLSIDIGLRQTIEKYLEVVSSDTTGPASSSSVLKYSARTIPACYRAPELFGDKPKASTATDIWALGASIFEIATGKLPLGHLGGEVQQHDTVLQDLPHNFSDDLNKIIKECLSNNEEDRPTANEIVEFTATFLKNRNYELPISSNGLLLNDNNNNLNSVSFYNIVGNKPKEKKTINWKKLALRILLPTVIAASILIIYYKWPLHSNQPEDSIKLIAEPPIVKTDTIDTAVVENPVTTVNPPPTIKKDTPSSAIHMAPPISPPIATKVPIYNKTEQPVKRVVPKPKQQKLIVDPGIPKHKDREQKAQ